MIGKLANQPCVLACIQRAVVIKKRRQHGLYKRLYRLRLHAQFARQEISGRFREDRDVQQVGLASGICEVTRQKRLGGFDEPAA